MEEFEREIEKIESPKITEKVMVDLIPKELLTNPYDFILNHYEKLFPNIGHRVFSVLSLLPISLIIPKYTINGRAIRSHLNLLWLSPPGFCKSQISEQFSRITFNPLQTKKMTTPRLYHEFKNMKDKKISLIVEDIAIWFMDEEKIKFLEGASGEEESYSHETMKNIKDGNKKHIDISCFCSGTPENITNKRLKEGILRRFSPLVLTLTKKEHLDVLNYQNNGLGKQGDYVDSSPIHQFYEELFKIQMNQNKEIPSIVDYIFPDHIKLKASSFFNPVGAKLHEIYGVNTATENEEFFRFMVCSAFLRIFEKKKNNMIQDNHLIIDDKDLEIAKKLIKNEMSTKNYIYYSIDRIDLDGVNTRKALKLWTEQRAKSGLKELPEEVNFLMKSNLRK